ncbi:MAG: gamma-glutamyltransferase [Candidatus Bathyarchaeota archaeon]|nr:MAG: gamma-glutamyltransferase [Candidatus Bathyarchaeota archaeon]
MKSKLLPVKNEVVANNAMVTTMQPQCAAAGLKILKQGGNAIDAAVAIGFCNTVVEAYKAGLSGQGIMLIYLANEDKTISIDFNSRSPQNAIPEMYTVTGISKLTNNIFEVENDAMRIGAKAVMVPGVPAGLCLAHEQFGILPRKQVMEPAITMALHGFYVNWDQTLYIANIMHRIQSVPLLAELWLPNGRPPRNFPAPGDKLSNPN